MSDEHLNRVDAERLQLSRAVSQVVKQAATILQQELTDGSGRATAMQKKYAATKKVDPNEFQMLSSRVRKDVHDLIAMAAEMFTELKTTEVQSLVSRMATDAHDVVDTTMNLVENAPATARTLANLGFTTPPAGPMPATGETSASDSAPESGAESGGEPPRPGV